MFKLITLFLVLLLAQPALAETKATFTVGVVPQFEARKLHGMWQPIIDYLNEKSDYHFELRGSPNIPAFEKALLAGEFDFAYSNPYHFLMANNVQNYQPLLRDIGRTLQGIVVVRKDSPIKTVDELNGKVLAFPAPNALGASLLIQSELLDFFNITVSPRFVKNHTSVYFNVILQEVSAGGGVQKTLNLQPDKVKNELRVLYATEPVAPHPLIVHPDVDSKVIEQFSSLLMDLGQHNEDLNLLSKIPMKEIGRATMDDYRPLISKGLERFYQRVD